MAREAAQTTEMEAILRLKPSSTVTRANLEDAAMDVERFLEQHARDLANGASASVDFEAPAVEIDIVLTGGDATELYLKLALVVAQLDRYCGPRSAPLGVGHFPMTVQSAEMRQRAPEESPLLAV
jgi:hypothetical protein